MILHCPTCKESKFQDMVHGKGNRVHNLCKHETYARCTICLNEKPLSKPVLREIKGKK